MTDDAFREAHEQAWKACLLATEAAIFAYLAAMEHAGYRLVGPAELKRLDLVSSRAAPTVAERLEEK